ncbi:MAG: hemerythrin domain-containing protein [Magnetococcus sp. WYHC-3]
MASPIKSTGIPIIDADHNRLLQILQQLIGQEPTVEFLLAMVDELGQYAAQHFDHEYQLMVACDYPPEALQRHLREHAGFGDRMARFAVLVREGGTRAQSALDRLLNEARNEIRGGATAPPPLATPAMQMASYLTQWLLTHTNGMDQEIVAFLKSRRIDPASIVLSSPSDPP